jgi:hypothetical protein
MNRLISRSLITVFALFVLFCVPSIASADGLTWTLMNVTFGDWTNFPPGATIGTVIGTGGTASGSFFYDANPSPIGAYGPISVSTTPWATTLSTAYTTLTPLANSNNGGLGLCSPPTCGTASDLTDASFLFLVFNDSPLFNNSLTNAGGTIPISTIPGDSMEELCLDSGCDSFDVRSVTGGDVFAVATPEPATFLLLGCGLLALIIGSAMRKVVSA